MLKFSPIVIRVDFPGLDRLLDFLEAAQQKEINAATAALQAVTTRFTNARTALEAIIQQGE